MSYTAFAYSGIKAKVAKGTLTVSLTVTNTGAVSGKDAVGIYVSAPTGGLDKPAVELKAFAKTGLLAPGASETLRLDIPTGSLASFNEKNGRWETARGEYTLRIGADVSRPAEEVKIRIR